MPDTRQDSRFAGNPLVTGEPHLRFYAGAVLKADDGLPIGTLCVLDHAPRSLTSVQQAALRVLARQVMKQLELRRSVLAREADLAAKTRILRQADALLTIGEEFRAMGRRDAIMSRALQVLGRTLDAPLAGYARPEPTGEAWIVESEWSAPGAHAIPTGPSIRLPVPHLERLRRGEVLAEEGKSARPSPGNVGQLFGPGAHLAVPVVENGLLVGLFYVGDHAPRHWVLDEHSFAKGIADRFDAALARVRAEDEQRVLNEELSHRLKNTMAMIQAIALQTLRHVSERDAVEAFEKRLMALSRAHDVLLQRTWSAARIMEVVESVLTLHGDRGRFDVEGPDVALGPRSTLSLSLLLHELSTNAVKYGALSNGHGRVDLAWHVEAGGDGRSLVLWWRETGGPPITEPTQTGFGSRLIQMGLAGTGHVTRRYPSSGLEAEFRAPIAFLSGN